jgi:SAM-dependent methyltransferase
MDRATWDARYSSPGYVWSTEPNRFLAAALADVEPAASGRALDLACGEGRNAVWLAGRGFRVTAVDWSDVALAKGRRLAETQGVDVEWVCADVVAQYEPPPAAFELVVVVYLQIPPDERRRVFAGATAAVESGGQLLAIGHDRRTTGLSGPTDPDLQWTPAEIAAELSPLTVVEAGERVRPLDDGEALDVIVRAWRA